MSFAAATAAKVAAKKAAKIASRKARQKAKEKGKRGGTIWVVLGAAGLAIYMVVQMLVGTITGGIMGGSQAGLDALQEAQCDTGGDAVGADVVYASNGPVRLPLTGKYTVTSEFGMRTQPRTGVYRLHAGIDLATTPSGGKIIAPKAGTVQSVNPNVPGAGNFIVLDHGGGIITRYLHLAEMHVQAGDKIKVGQTIGREGNTTGGTNISTGSHLHFEVRKNNNPINPRDWLKDNGITVPAKGGSAIAESKPSSGSPSGGSATASADPSSSSSSSSSSGSSASAAPASNDDSGSSDFALPKADMSDVKHAKDVKPMSIPSDILPLYKEAAEKYGLPWALLAGVGMEETNHGRLKSVSVAGAAGHMQFMPAAWVDHGVDGDGDGNADINNPADSIHSAANKLASQGAKSGPQGVKDALFAYNRATWYGNDVLHYAHYYGKGNVTVSSATASGGEECENEPGAEDGGGNVKMASAATTDCKESGSPGEKGLQPGALNGLRCGVEAAPWVETALGVGERAGPSDHGSGNAVDFMISNYDSPAQRKRGWDLAKWFKTNAADLDVKYVIFDQKIWNPGRGNEWRPMENRGNDTQNHLDHVHVSFN